MNLDNLSVVVTGASSGIGQAIAGDLASQGVAVMCAARREDRLKQLVDAITAAGGKAEYRVVDVRQRDQMQSLIDETVAAFGKIDVLVNNAGVMPLSRMEKLHLDEWERMIDVNIKGVLWGVAAALPKMLEAGAGHLINVSSIAGHIVFPGCAVYCATKFAVRAISEGLRQELAGRVRVTNISPGAVDTELAHSISDDDIRQGLQPVLDIAIDPQAIADAVRFAIAQPNDVSVNEMIIRPTSQQL